MLTVSFQHKLWQMTKLDFQALQGWSLSGIIWLNASSNWIIKQWNVQQKHMQQHH